VDWNWCSTRVATGAAINSPSDVSELIEAGVTAVVDTRAEFTNVDIFRTMPGLTYLWHPTNDDGQPKGVVYWDQLLTFALILLARPRARISCHCGAGVNRGPSAAFAVLVAQGWTPEGAEALIRQNRPQVGLAYRDDAVQACRMLGYCR
jgi:protein-tyrosine phosphatase